MGATRGAVPHEGEFRFAFANDRIAGLGLSRELRGDHRFKSGSNEFMITLTPIGTVESPLTRREEAPKQGNEGAPSAWLSFASEFEDALRELSVGDEILVLTWLDRADRTILRVHPRDDHTAPIRGVFSTRSQDRPNPIGIHRVTIEEVGSATRLRVSGLEAFDGTPIVDVKPVLDRLRER